MKTTRSRVALGVHTLEDRTTPTVSSIGANFNKTAIPAGDTIWFSAVGQISGVGTGTTSIDLSGGTITIPAKTGTVSVTVPETIVTYTPLATQATTSFSGGDWVVTVPSSYPGNVFFGGAAVNVANTLPGKIKNVTWKTNVTSDTPGIAIAWQWGAAVYTSFDASAAYIKAVGNKHVDMIHNSDQPGTPEAFKDFLVAGATGNGHHNYTGSSSGVATLTASVAAGGGLSGEVVLDNGDGIINSSDTGFAGVEVDLLDGTGTVVARTSTLGDGSYTFKNLAAGTYSIVVVPPDTTYNVIFPDVGTAGGDVDPSWAAIDNIQLGNSVNGTGYNFGLSQSGGLS
jgi:hypothetical protein